MRLPAPLSRRDLNVHKNTFGHVLILAGSRHMLGAAALTGLAAMRCGAGLVTIGVPASLNLALQKKISPVIMSLGLPETPQGSLAAKAFSRIEEFFGRCQVLALGPGLSRTPSTQRLVGKILNACPLPMVVDADALTQSPSFRTPDPSKNIRILTPHPGEMARMIGRSKDWVEAHRAKAARDFAKTHGVVLLLKGHRTVVAAPDGKIFINTTGNPGMATAGSGDVLTGMIAALLAQGLDAFAAAKWGAFLHGTAGDIAAREKTRAAMIATDILEALPQALRQSAGKTRI